jgi:diguanylate cyclase
MPAVPKPVNPPARQTHNSADAIHAQRVRRLVLISSAVVVLVCGAWATHALIAGMWILVGSYGLAATAGSCAIVLTLQKRLRLAARVLLGVMYGVLTCNSLLMGNTVEGVPRSPHLLLLATGVVAFLLMRREPIWLRRLAPAVCFATFVALSLVESPWLLPTMVNHGSNRVGLIVNTVITASIIYISMLLMQSEASLRQRDETELRDALLGQQLLLHYQPQVDAEGQVRGAEALVRWSHPVRGMVPPGDFIPLAERTGLMQPLGEWVLREGCMQLARWAKNPRTAALDLAINVSAAQFDDDGFVQRVCSTIEATGANPRRVKLELTESLLAGNLDDIVAKMKALKQIGVRFSLDDFGTGFSSLSYLQRLPLHQLKIDQSFVRDMLSADNGAAIAQTVVELGRKLGLEVIAEGVETEAHRRALAEMDCVFYQGYLFSKPVPVEAFEAYVARQLVPERGTGTVMLAV